MIIHDEEFGEVLVRKNSLSRGVKFSISASGRLQISVPSYTSPLLAERFLKTNRKRIRAQLPLRDPSTQRARDAKKKLLTKQAKDYLPYRLEYFAKLYGYAYDKLRFGHQISRWGSCTRHHDGTTVISLNIALMNVPEALRDYVLLHELAHLNHPDHSAAFWREVEEHDPAYRTHRERLKGYSPAL